jgi:hypothetical protein
MYAYRNVSLPAQRHAMCEQLDTSESNVKTEELTIWIRWASWALNEGASSFSDLVHTPGLERKDSRI